MTLTIVSGGQTGVDRGAFEVALRLGLDFGGWAPQGFRAEDGRIPEVYARHMRESIDEGYALRTRLNVQDSDATLILSFSSTPEKAGGGTWFTEKVCRQQGKQCVHLRLPRAGEEHPPEVQDGILKWLRLWSVGVLNVAGPRESKCPGIQAATIVCLRWILEPFAVEEVRQTTSVLDTITRIAADLPNRPERPPITIEDALRQVAHTGSEDAKTLALAELERRSRPYAPGEKMTDRHPDSVIARVVEETIAKCLGPPEGLDDLQRAQLDASIREAERDVRDEPEPTTDNYGPDGSGGW